MFHNSFLWKKDKKATLHVPTRSTRLHSDIDWVYDGKPPPKSPKREVISTKVTSEAKKKSASKKEETKRSKSKKVEPKRSVSRKS